MIIVTGAAGFIGSCMIQHLNEHNFNRIIAVDDFSHATKEPNLVNKRLEHRIDRNDFLSWLDVNHEETEFIFHLGARTDTTERDRDLLWKLNTDYSKSIWKRCINYQIPLIYASSAATYGDGSLGYREDNDMKQLRPLNAYGESKHSFDLWALEQETKPFYWAGLKFFNVYGPNEYHKGRMASVVYHAYKQVSETGRMKLFRSHHPDYTDGGQMRDFVYVKDVISVMYWLMHHRKDSGIYNLGTGKAQTFRALVDTVFEAMDAPPGVDYIDTPADIRDKYQYFTEANMSKLRDIGYTNAFRPLEEGVKDYVANYLNRTPGAPHYF